ncbi:hypothetical protein XELAEV_18009857mg [Xenopus laevis]|uniref:Uncharacterized protein n=1 Tax=Xenopus laevis TaxID=8355 RepID=A0A974DTK6_XENLA|nr:hypothetical protein XELAEV_18009857mg [Xenopus laevis]
MLFRRCHKWNERHPCYQRNRVLFLLADHIVYLTSTEWCCGHNQCIVEIRPILRLLNLLHRRNCIEAL